MDQTEIACASACVVVWVSMCSECMTDMWMKESVGWSVRAANYSDRDRCMCGKCVVNTLVMHLWDVGAKRCLVYLFSILHFYFSRWLPSDRCRRRHLLTFVGVFLFWLSYFSPVCPVSFYVSSQHRPAHKYTHIDASVPIMLACSLYTLTLCIHSHRLQTLFLLCVDISGMENMQACTRLRERTKKNSEITPTDFSSGCYMLRAFDRTSPRVTQHPDTAHMDMMMLFVSDQSCRTRFCRWFERKKNIVDLVVFSRLTVSFIRWSIQAKNKY